MYQREVKARDRFSKISKASTPAGLIPDVLGVDGKRCFISTSFIKYAGLCISRRLVESSLPITIHNGRGQSKFASNLRLRHPCALQSLNGI